ncbi:MAG: glycoside hydrolase 100 family protein [Candidatus Woesearchaeota archaeon]
MENIIEITYQKAIEILKKNITRKGFTASSENIANYHSIWARDHSICSIAAVLTSDSELIKCAKDGLFFLLNKQIDHGQVPSYVEIESKKKIYGGLGSITTIDSNMWIVIACAIFYKKTNEKRFISTLNTGRYKRFYRLFKAFDSNDCGLMEVHIASDWADIMNRTYHVLYDQCLYYESLRALQYLFANHIDKISHDNPSIQIAALRRLKWVSKRKPKVKRKINSVLWFDSKNIDKIKEEYLIYDDIPKKSYSYYQSHVMPFKHEWSQRFDTFGNLLAVLTKIANSRRRNKIVNYVVKEKINKPFPIKALSPPIFKKDKDWERIYDIKDKPYTYHNAGIWPMLSGFWINALMKANKPELAKTELLQLAKLLKKEKYTFHEYMNGKSSKSMGTPYQAWSAAGYIIAYHSVKSNVNLFDF